MTRFQIAPLARFDIEEVLAYLEERSEFAAIRWEDELYGSLHRLAAFPLSAQVRVEFADAPVRVQVMGEYLIFYDPSREPLLVLRVLRASRNITQRLLSSEET